MKIERTKNATRSIMVGSIMKVYQMFVPFLMRTLMIYFMGVQYLGLNSLFTSILQVLNLAELGVGSAMVFSMYKPIAEDDKSKICALMKLYRTYYRVIGGVIGVVGLIITPFVPNLISGEVPGELNVYILYLLNLAATVLSYWLFAYKNCLLQAHQRIDVTSIVVIAVDTLQYIIQAVIIIFIKDFYIYTINILAMQAVKNIVTAAVVTKMYPEYKPVGSMAKNEVSMINRRIRDLFTGKLGAVILNSADTIVISAFLGLTVLAVYQNYYFILTAIIGFVEIIINSMMAGLGNSFITETKEKNFLDFKKFTFMFCWLTGLCACCFLCLYQPFMEIWVGKELMLEFGAVICFSVYFFVYEINRLLNVYKDAAGLWHEDRFRPLATALVNLGLNLILVQYIGIYGVLLSTVISMVAVGMPWLLHNMFTVFFERSLAKTYIIKLFVYVGAVVLAGAVTYFICSFIHLNEWLTLIVRAMLCATVPNLIFFILFRKKPEFRQGVQMVDRMLKGKLRLEQILFRKS